MKIFKFLAMLTISVLLFTGCEKEEITNYAFQEISAPTNVNAIFDVAQDDSGKVTITPSGEGAQVFQVYFGDGDDSPIEVAQGETVSYTYEEGEYLVKVIAVGSTGLTSEFNQRLLISFRAPENLEVTVTQSANNPAMISVSAAADYAATFDVYFGDIEEEEPTQLMPEGSIDHTYASPGTYTVRVLAQGAGVAATETTVEVVVPEANDPVKLPITYDNPTVNYALGTFEGATFEVVTNPFLAGANTAESRVGKLVNNGGLYEGGAYTLVEPVDFSGANKTISMKFYSDQPISVLVKFEGGTNNDRQNEVAASHGGTGWEVLIFNFATDAVKSYVDGDPDNGASFVPTGKYSSLVIFAEIGKTTTGTFYIDDIMQPGDEATDPITAASPPTDDAANVFSLFSDSYTDPSAINYYPDWGQTTAYEMVNIDGNNFIKYSNVNYQGIDFSQIVDATIYTSVIIDVWSGDYTSIPFFLISSSGEKSVNLEVVPNQWNHIEIPLTDFTSQGLEVNDVFQIKFDVQPDNGGTFYIDNLYFN